MNKQTHPRIVTAFLALTFVFVSFLSDECLAQSLRLQGVNCNLEPRETAPSFVAPVRPAAGKSWKVTNDFGNVVTNADIPGLPSGYWQHTGVDYLLDGRSAQSQRQSVYASANGIVVFSTGPDGNKNPLPKRGGMIMIRHLAPRGMSFHIPSFERSFTTVKQFTTVSYPSYDLDEVFTYYLHLDTDKILVNQGDYVTKGSEIARLYASADFQSGNFAYPPHLHFEVWIKCVDLERNGYDGFGEEFKRGVGSPVIDPLTFLSNVRVSQKERTEPTGGRIKPQAPGNGERANPRNPIEDGYSGRFDLNGEWIGTGYNPGADRNRVRIRQTGNKVEATKITGTTFIPAGQITWYGTYTSNPFYGKIQIADRDFTNPRWASIEIKVFDKNHLSVTLIGDDPVTGRRDWGPVMFERATSSVR